MTDSDKFGKTFSQQMREVSEAALMNSMITGVSYIKMTIDPNTTEIKMEFLNPFKRCDCEPKE